MAHKGSASNKIFEMPHKPGFEKYKAHAATHPNQWLKSVDAVKEDKSRFMPKKRTPQSIILGHCN